MGASTEEQLIQKQREIEATRERLTRDTDELGDKISPQRIVQRRTEAAKGRLGSVRERVMGTASDVRSSAGSAGTSAGSGASGAVDAVEDRVYGNPLTAGLVAFGVGMVVSAALPPSAKEQQVGRKAVDVAREHGAPVLDEVKSFGQDLGDELKDHAAQAAEQVMTTAEEAAANVKEEAQSSADAVKDQAQTSSTGTGTGTGTTSTTSTTSTAGPATPGFPGTGGTSA